MSMAARILKVVNGAGNAVRHTSSFEGPIVIKYLFEGTKKEMCPDFRVEEMKKKVGLSNHKIDLSRVSEASFLVREGMVIGVEFTFDGHNIDGLHTRCPGAFKHEAAEPLGVAGDPHIIGWPS